jgi:ParB-like chromosome segregation protein Spo0J
MNFQVLPPLSAEDYAALKSDIAARGVLVPVEYDEEGNVLDGHHRVQICGELGITTWPKLIRKGLTDTERRTHARQLNLARRHLDQAARRTLIGEELREHPERSNRQIASSLGVSHPTVADVRGQMESTGKIYQLKKTVGADGKERPAHKPIRTRRDTAWPAAAIVFIKFSNHLHIPGHMFYCQRYAWDELPLLSVTKQALFIG